MAISSIAYQATILTGQPIPQTWLNDTGADVQVGTFIKMGSIWGIVAGGNSQDGSTNVLSTTRGSAIFTPGITVDAPAFTTATWATGTLVYWDSSNSRLDSTAVGSGGKMGYAANSKAAGANNGAILFNQTQVV